jgi:hypothetical protein
MLMSIGIEHFQKKKFSKRYYYTVTFLDSNSRVSALASKRI